MKDNFYASFVQTLLSGGEGVLMSVKGHDLDHVMYAGSGVKQAADFETGPFPLFSLHDFAGTQVEHWHFKNFKSHRCGTDLVEIPVLEALSTGLGLEDWERLCSETKSSYTYKVKALQEHARDGEFWVANFTQSISGALPHDTDPRLLVLKLFYEFLKQGHPHCGGVFITKEQIFCSFSPEIFLQQKGDLLKTFPIKGTGSKAQLSRSPKEVSELSMITDLMRNDLGQICHPVWVAQERYLTPEPHFHHARAEIQGRLKNEFLTEANYQSLLPAGSISGAPKVRVQALLKEFESFDRQFYTGTFGVRLSAQESLFNILIRTLFVDPNAQTWAFPVGGGITIESDPEAEWEESLKKAEILRDCLKS